MMTRGLLTSRKRVWFLLLKNIFFFFVLLIGKSTFMSLVDSKNWIGSTTIATNPQAHTMNRPTVVSSAVAMPFAQQPTTQSTRRNTGGRRPQKNNGVSCVKGF